MTTRRAFLLAALALWGCGEGEVPIRDRDADTGSEEPAPAPERPDVPGGPGALGDFETPPDSVILYFTLDEVPAPVRRPAPALPTEAVAPETALAGALELLVRGPTEEEREAGYWSWFSMETAHVLRSARVDEVGHAVVDFRDLRSLIPGAASSAGSEALLGELNGTVFQVPGIRSVEYRMEGSCSRFWEWLQYGCQTVGRPEG